MTFMKTSKQVKEENLVIAEVSCSCFYFLVAHRNSSSHPAWLLCLYVTLFSCTSNSSPYPLWSLCMSVHLSTPLTDRHSLSHAFGTCHSLNHAFGTQCHTFGTCHSLSHAFGTCHSLSHTFGPFHSLSHTFGTENISVLSTSSHHHSLSSLPL